ncbi:MAG: hypothetical protein M3406_10110 [Chloroflexota bacterium]|nr:hypothetical protein [Chloroflexota bacterium]
MAAARRSATRVTDVMRFRHIRPDVVWLSLYTALNFGLALYFVRFGEQGDWSLWASLPDALARGKL